MAHDVFISYSSEDKTVAEVVCATLETNGIRCWVAARDIVPGNSWGKSIAQAIAQSRAMVLIFSSNADRSEHVAREVERATSKGVPIIPFRIEAITPSSSLEYFLSTLHWLDALTPPLDSHSQRLAHNLHSLLGMSPERVREEEVYDSASHSTAADQTARDVTGRVQRARLTSAPVIAVLSGSFMLVLLFVFLFLWRFGSTAGDPELIKRLISNRFEVVHIISPSAPSPVKMYMTEEEAKQSLGGTVPANRRVLPYEGESINTERQSQTKTSWLVVESPAIIDGMDLRDCRSVPGQEEYHLSGKVSCSLTKEGKDKFSSWTGTNINQYIGVMLNGNIKQVVWIKSQITDPIFDSNIE